MSEAFREEILGQLPALEEDLDLGDERRDHRSKVGVGFGGFEAVQELLADKVFEGWLRSELAFDDTRRFALLDQTLVQTQNYTRRTEESTARCIAVAELPPLPLRVSSWNS